MVLFSDYHANPPNHHVNPLQTHEKPNWKPRAPGHEFGIKTTFPLTNTLAVRRFLSNFLDVSLFKESKKRSEEKGK